jgi:hypothetical protein
MLPNPNDEPTIDGHRTAEIFGCSYWSLLEQVKAETAPVMPLRLGRKYRWPTSAVLRAVGLESERDGGAATNGAPASPHEHPDQGVSSWPMVQTSSPFVKQQ